MKRFLFIFVAVTLMVLSGCGKQSSKNNKEDTINTEAVVEENDSESNEIYEVEQEEYGDDVINNMYSDWYDEAGNLLWSAITPEQASKLSKSEKKNFKEWWDEYSVSYYDTDEDTILKINTEGKSPREYMSALCLEYNGLIPFAIDGREYGKGYDKYNNGFDNRYWKQEYDVAFGLDSEGYLIWLFRNTFGYTPSGMDEGISSMYSKEGVEHVEINELQVGDICMLTDDINASYNMYGVVAGTYQGHIIVSLCDNIGNPKFTDGSTRLAYIVDEYNTAIGESMPIDFKYFFRISSMDWGE